MIKQWIFNEDKDDVIENADTVGLALGGHETVNKDTIGQACGGNETEYDNAVGLRSGICE